MRRPPPAGIGESDVLELDGRRAAGRRAAARPARVRQRHQRLGGSSALMPAAADCPTIP